MATYTEEQITELFSCGKQIIEAPKELKLERGSYRTQFKLQSLDNKFSFNCFIRKNGDFPENFSIGLDYKPKEEKGVIPILRFNGKHGENKVFPHHISCHVHFATPETINAGLKPESNIKMTTEYETLEDALQYFLKYINVIKEDRQIYFPPKNDQISFEY